MIYVHRFRSASGLNHKDHARIYDDYEQAKAQQCVLGGSIQAYEAIENLESEWAEREHIKELIVDEVSCLIDDLTTDAPGSPRNYEPGSPQWDSWKVKTLNNVRNILDGKFNEI